MLIAAFLFFALLIPAALWYVRAIFGPPVLAVRWVPGLGERLEEWITS